MKTWDVYYEWRGRKETDGEWVEEVRVKTIDGMRMDIVGDNATVVLVYDQDGDLIYMQDQVQKVTLVSKDPVEPRTGRATEPSF